MSATLTVSLADIEQAFRKWVSDDNVLPGEEYLEYRNNTSTEQQTEDALQTFLSYLKD